MLMLIQSWVLSVDYRPALLLFDDLNEQTIWLWVTGGFINLLAEVVKMQFCCSLAFPWGQRSLFPLCWVVLSLGEGVPIFFCCAGLAGRGLLQWVSGCF